MSYIFSILLTISTFTCLFRQEKQMQIMQQTQLSEGKMTYRAPDYLRWEYTAPEPIVWEMDGNNSNMNRQVKAIVSLILNSINGEYLKDNNQFEVTRQGDIYTLIPKKRELQRLFEQMTIEIDKQTDIARKVTFTEKNGDTTVIRFFDLQTQ